MQETATRRADHWQFALACAVDWIKEQVYAFDFEASLSGHAAYVGITPEWLIANIDGFLSEKEVVPGGTMTELGQLRSALKESITPAYQTGVAAAQQEWRDAEDDEQRIEMNTPPEDVAVEARQRVPANWDASQANWFVEGYCFAWAQEWFAFMVAHLDDQAC